MKPTLTLLTALLLSPLLALHADDQPAQATPTSDPAGQAAAAAAILRDATAVWSMAAETAASVQLKGDAKLGVALGGSFRSGSLAHGGDGVVAELAGGCIEGARDLRLEGSALTLLLRLRNPTNTWTPGELFSKNGGPDKMVFNLYAKTGIIGVELGVDGVKGIAARVTMPQDNTFMRSGKWNDIIVRYDGRDLTLFANGLVWGKVRGKPGPLRQGNHEPVLIGSNFAGQIDHAALWARALSDAEIVTLCGGEAEMKPRLYESRYELAPEQPSREAKAIVSQPRVQFRTSNSVLQKAFNEAEKQAKLNVRDFGKYKIMVEGQGYRGVWLETQPMGGCMYAKRDIEVARNNQLIFMDFQREDGRLPGAIGFLPPFYKQGQMVIRYQELQGGYLPLEAFDVYYWIGKDREYLKKLYTALDKFDNYFWKTRDSDHNGCLESYCGGDTGEDNSGRFSIRFGRAHHTWPFDYPPTYDSPMPMESMDMMSYSFGNRAILAQIAEILQNGQSEYWRSKALEVQKKLKEYLWIPERHACFDRDKNNAVMDVLCHNNLRCMYFGSFDQQMAEEFIKYHLMNPKEFWTPLPLPSIAANDPAFRNIPGNNWSGKSQGLTFQRSIRALENYGHYAELTLIGQQYLTVIGESLEFPQQFDPFTATVDKTSGKTYGPSILSTLEFISRLYGIHISREKVYWSCLDDQQTNEYSQEWNNRWYQMATKGDRVICSINGKEVFSFTKGIRVVTDGNGKIIETIGISTKDQNAIIEVSGKSISLTVAPNAIYSFTGNKFQESRKVEFYRPAQP